MLWRPMYGPRRLGLASLQHTRGDFARPAKNKVEPKTGLIREVGAQ